MLNAELLSEVIMYHTWSTGHRQTRQADSFSGMALMKTKVASEANGQVMGWQRWQEQEPAAWASQITTRVHSVKAYEEMGLVWNPDRVETS